MSEYNFENGKPVNEPYWSELKRLVNSLNEKPVLITMDFINKTFNRQIDAITGRARTTSKEHFMYYCALNHLEYDEREDLGGFLV